MLPRPERLRFHQATMDLLGQVPAISNASLALLERPTCPFEHTVWQYRAPIASN